ncbi:MAG: DUF3450 family protein [Campylobacterota bacterium]|nr:DUF3450 family protein [Campylobacterota bacterium]
MYKNLVSLCLTTSIVTSSLLAGSSVENMAQSLMKLRADVQRLDTQIQDEKDAYKASMKSLVMEKNELETTLAREDLRMKQIKQELDKVKKQIEAASANSEGIKPLVQEALTTLKAQINSDLPFKTKDRIADLENIESQLEADLITPQKALALTWNSYSDAIRMTKENGTFKQTITLDSAERLAEIARVGMVMMYFKTPDERVGYVQKDASGYFYQESVAKEEQVQILALFDAFKKQIRSGYFTMPNALVEAK